MYAHWLQQEAPVRRTDITNKNDEVHEKIVDFIINVDNKCNLMMQYKLNQFIQGSF